MKKIWFILLIMLLPLQTALAAVEAYHGHDTHHQQSDHTAHADADLKSGSICEGDHHHCHGHTTTVLPDCASLHFNSSNFQLQTEWQGHFQTHLSNRIERPKWA